MHVNGPLTAHSSVHSSGTAHRYIESYPNQYLIHYSTSQNVDCVNMN